MSIQTHEPGTALVSFPVGISAELFTAIGGLLSAALAPHGDLVLAASGGAQSASLVLNSNLAQWQVAAAVRAATEQIDPTQVTARLDGAQPPEDADDPVTIGHLAHNDGEISVGVSGAEAAARELAANLASVMLPAMDLLGASNYLSWDFTDRDQPGARWNLTITRPGGLTPHEIRERFQQFLTWLVGHDPGPGKRPGLRLREVFDRAREALAATQGPRQPPSTAPARRACQESP